jgi:Cytochrome b5-like Heme/Steroid binding domain
MTLDIKSLWQWLDVYTQEHFWVSLVVVFLTALFVSYLWTTQSPAPKPYVYEPFECGNITLDSLAKHNGLDPFLPIYISIRGKVYDVTPARSFYGRGAPCRYFVRHPVLYHWNVRSYSERLMQNRSVHAH